VLGANETKLGISADLFAPSSFTVNKGDSVFLQDRGRRTSYIYNLERHYHIDKNVPSEKNATIVFKADHEAIFRYYCKYHLPTMVGQLIVLH